MDEKLTFQPGDVAMDGYDFVIGPLGVWSDATGELWAEGYGYRWYPTGRCSYGGKGDPGRDLITLLERDGKPWSPPPEPAADPVKPVARYTRAEDSKQEIWLSWGDGADDIALTVGLQNACDGLPLYEERVWLTLDQLRALHEITGMALAQIDRGEN